MNLSLSRARLGAIKFGIGIFCILVGGSLPIQSASAAETAAANPDPGKRFATVLRVRGEVVASGGSNGAQRTLREGDTIYVGERVRAPALAEAVLKTEDAGFLAIRPNTDFVAERFAAEDKPTDNFTVRLFTGSLRVVSGWLGRTARGGHKVVTPTATIGIRGTDHEPYVLSAELAASTSNREGTYDKVNRGGTTMEVGENKLDIDAGRVGFVRAAGKGFKERALITILLPVLLDKVPNFYEILTEQPGKNSWPITGASFILMHAAPADAKRSADVLAFFNWSLKNGQKLATELDYVPMPDPVVKLIETMWKTEIKGPAGPVWK